MTDHHERFTVLDGGPTPDERDERLTDGADELLAEGRRGSLGAAREHLLLTIAATVLTLGFSVILIGWAGAANATVVEEQIPYLISGGLLGLALVTFGSLTLFSHWQTVRIREARLQEAVAPSGPRRADGRPAFGLGSNARRRRRANGGSRAPPPRAPLSAAADAQAVLCVAVQARRSSAAQRVDDASGSMPWRAALSQP